MSNTEIQVSLFYYFQVTEEESYYIEEKVTLPKREEVPPAKGTH